MTLTAWEAAARHFESAKVKRWETPGHLALALDGRTVQTPALDLIDEALVELANTPDGRLIISMPPQEGKSQRVTRRFVTWMLNRSPNCRVAIASYEANVARRWGRVIRDDINTHGDELGLAVRKDLSAQAEWQLLGSDGGVYSVGIGGALTGRAVDLLVIDDPIKDRKQADSLAYRDAVWDWWTDVASTRLAPGAPVVLVLTRWHEDDLAARLTAHADGHLWKVINIPAQAERDDDPLRREIGEFMRSARGRTLAQWAAIKVRVGPRTWAALYQGTPSPLEGDILKREWWQRFNEPQHIVREDGSCWVPEYDEMIQSWDFTFTDTKDSDYVVGQVWMRRGIDIYLLHQVRGRMNFVASCDAMRSVTALWPQALLKVVENKANGPAIMAALAREVIGIVPEDPDGSKEARAHAVSPIAQSKNIHLPADKIAPWAAGFIEEAASFPNGANDDQVDAFTQAAKRLILIPLLAGGEVVEASDLYDDVETAISPF